MLLLLIHVLRLPVSRYSCKFLVTPAKTSVLVCMVFLWKSGGLHLVLRLIMRYYEANLSRLQVFFAF